MILIEVQQRAEEICLVEMLRTVAIQHRLIDSIAAAGPGTTFQREFRHIIKFIRPIVQTANRATVRRNQDADFGGQAIANSFEGGLLFCATLSVGLIGYS